MAKAITSTHEFVKKYSPEIVFVLLYGDNNGLINHYGKIYAQKVAKFFAIDLDDEFSTRKLQYSDLEGNLALLHNEIATPPMFGEHKIIWIKNMRQNAAFVRELDLILQNLVKTGKKHNFTLIMQAGCLRPNESLRDLAKKYPKIGRALTCYIDNKGLVGELIDEELKKLNLTIESNAKNYLVQNLNCDYLLAKSEIEKICLYAKNDKIVNLQHIYNIAADVTDYEPYDLIDDIIARDYGKFQNDFRAFIKGKGSASQILSYGMHALEQFKILRQKYEERATDIQHLLRSARPIISFERQKIWLKHFKSWHSKLLIEALIIMEQNLLLARKNSKMADLMVKNCAYEIITKLK